MVKKGKQRSALQIQMSRNEQRINAQTIPINYLNVVTAQQDSLKLPTQSLHPGRSRANSGAS